MPKLFLVASPFAGPGPAVLLGSEWMAGNAPEGLRIGVAKSCPVLDGTAAEERTAIQRGMPRWRTFAVPSSSGWLLAGGKNGRPALDGASILPRASFQRRTAGSERKKEPSGAGMRVEGRQFKKGAQKVVEKSQKHCSPAGGLRQHGSAALPRRGNRCCCCETHSRCTDPSRAPFSRKLETLNSILETRTWPKTH
jgi:hypothetical protein